MQIDVKSQVEKIRWAVGETVGSAGGYLSSRPGEMRRA
jgi:hypothetical protein